MTDTEATIEACRALRDLGIPQEEPRLWATVTVFDSGARIRLGDSQTGICEDREIEAWEAEQEVATMRAQGVHVLVVEHQDR